LWPKLIYQIGPSVCAAGYEVDDVTTCVDIDECEDNNGGCDHVCVNKPGTYTCEMLRAPFRLHFIHC
jgi:hypothetical protein